MTENNVSNNNSTAGTSVTGRDNSLETVSDKIDALLSGEVVSLKVQDEFQLNESGRYQFRSANKVLDSLYISDTVNRLYVFLSSADAYNRNIEPVFARSQWSSFFKGHKLFLDDMYRHELSFAPTFYYRSLEEVEIIVRRLAISKKIKAQDITFIASTSGAFAASYLASSIEGSSVIALSPVFAMLNAFPKRTRSLEFISKMRIDEKDVNKGNPKLTLFNVFNNKKSRFFFYLNLQNEEDLKQINILFTELKEPVRTGLIKYRKNIIFWIVDNDMPENTRRMPGLAFCKFIDDTFVKDKKIPEEEVLTYLTGDYMVPVI